MVMKENVLNGLLESDDNLLQPALRTAESKIKNALLKSYDVAHELTRTGTRRNAELVMAGVNITVYLVLRRRPVADRMADAAADYEQAEKFLSEVAKGMRFVDVKTLQKTDPEGNSVEDAPGMVITGSRNRRNYL